MKYIITPGHGSGIGSVIVGLLSAFLHLKNNNINSKVYVNVHYASKPVNILFTCFLDLENINSIIVINESKSNLVYYSNYKELFFKVNENVYGYVDDFVFNSFENLWKIKPWNKRINTEEIDICVNIRRGDKITLEPSQKVCHVIDYMNTINNIEPKNLIYHTSDDYSTYIEMKNINPNLNIKTLCQPSDSGFHISSFNSADNHYVVNHVQKFLNELSIMQDAKVFIGSSSTSVWHLVMVLRKNKNMILL